MKFKVIVYRPKLSSYDSLTILAQHTHMLQLCNNVTQFTHYYLKGVAGSSYKHQERKFKSASRIFLNCVGLKKITLGTNLHK